MIIDVYSFNSLGFEYEEKYFILNIFKIKIKNN